MLAGESTDENDSDEENNTQLDGAYSATWIHAFAR